jgi:hypothetical protein
MHRCSRRPPRRALGNHRQRHRLDRAQIRRLLAEIDQARRANALNVPAIGREIQIGLENFPLRAVELKVDRRHDLQQLASDRPRIEMIMEPRQLHRDRRRAEQLPLSARIGPARPCQCQRIDPRVVVEIAVLMQQRHLDELRRDLLQRHEDPVTIIVREAKPQ